jgi:protoheme IX farnesyltransferase
MNLENVKTYYWLAKPNMVYGNLFTTLGGFLFASQGHWYIGLLVATLCGTGLIIGSACVFNNYFDREIDSQMERTKNRALVKGLVSKRAAILYGVILGLIGFVVLALGTNYPTVMIGTLGFLVYIFWYTPSKHKSIYSTLIGTISGATPIVAGYIAVTNKFDLAAFILFLIMIFWQMVHFYSIGIYRHDEYKAASIPILPVLKGVKAAKRHIIFYLALYIAAVEMLYIYGYVGRIYFAVMSLLALNWLSIYIKGLRQTTDEKKWARKMFLYSLVVLMTFSVLIALDYSS